MHVPRVETPKPKASRLTRRNVGIGLAALGTAAAGTALYKNRKKKRKASAEKTAESMQEFRDRRKRNARIGIGVGTLGLGALGALGARRAARDGLEQLGGARALFQDAVAQGMDPDEAAYMAEFVSKNVPRVLGATGAATAGTVGAIGGGVIGHKATTKEGSLAEYSVLFDKIADGDLGEEAQHALHGICQAIEVPNNAEKTASVYDVTNLSESDARKARLDQLLKR